MSYLLHPELFERIPLQGGKIAELIDGQAKDVAQREAHRDPSSVLKDPNITIAVRTFNEDENLERLF